MNQDTQSENQTEKETWVAPHLSEIDIRSTEGGLANGPDGGGGGFTAS